MRLIDTHAHLDFPQLRGTLQEVLTRAGERGVVKIISVGIDERTSLAALEISRLYPGVVYPTLGIHPHDAKNFNPALAKRFRALLEGGGFVAVGETGLDYAKEYSPKKVQRDVFTFQLQLARSYDLPVIVHSREADKDTIEILKSEAREGLAGVIHCFSGGTELLEVALNLDFFISCSGIITFPQSQDLRSLVEICPVERLLIETDSPFLAPVPHRGKVNEPGFVYYVARELARIRSMDLEEVIYWTTKNAMDLFGSIQG